MNKVMLISIFSVIILVFISGCSQNIADDVSEESGKEIKFNSGDKAEEKTEKVPGKTQEAREEKPEEGQEKVSESKKDWRDFELSNVLTGEKFKISDFKGKKILLESFAVWCPLCLQQQKEIKKLIEMGDNSVHISLDTDPNEEELLVKAHANKNNFDWYFAVSPAELTQKLIEEFGISIVNAPSSPVILICEDQSARFLRSGVKSASELKSEIAKRC